MLYNSSIIFFFVHQENASKHISVIPAASYFPEKFDRCGDESCSSPCNGKLYHCSLCAKADKKPLAKPCKLKEHFRKVHWDHKVTEGGQSYFFLFSSCQCNKFPAFELCVHEGGLLFNYLPRAFVWSFGRLKD